MLLKSLLYIMVYLEQKTCVPAMLQSWDWLHAMCLAATGGQFFLLLYLWVIADNLMSSSGLALSLLTGPHLWSWLLLSSVVCEWTVAVHHCAWGFAASVICKIMRAFVAQPSIFFSSLAMSLEHWTRAQGGWHYTGLSSFTCGRLCPVSFLAVPSWISLCSNQSSKSWQVNVRTG